MNWTISVAHIKGTFNVLADQLSRGTVISTEWSLPAQAFKQQVLIHEPRAQVDLFTTSLNHKLKQYVSPCPDINACALDVMSTNWKRWEYLYLFPPAPMILKALHKLKQSNIRTALFITPRTLVRAPWYDALSSLLTLKSTFEVKLQQKVIDRMVRCKKTSTLLMWKYSK